MADSEQQPETVVFSTADMTETTQVVTIPEHAVIGRDIVTEEILLQAMEQSNGVYNQQVNAQYTTESACVDSVLADGSGAELTQELTLSAATVSEAMKGQVVMTDASGATYTLVAANQETDASEQTEALAEVNHNQIQESNNGLAEGTPAEIVDDTQIVQEEQMTVIGHENVHYQPVSGAADQQTVTSISDQSLTSECVIESVPPVGSSDNPIRIVQQGNQYTSLQQLTKEQLSQIMQVVQQQQLHKNNQSGSGSCVLYNPQTQTRIVYKVIYPSELHKNSSSPSSKPKTIQVTVPTSSASVNSASTKRTYKKRRLDDDDSLDGPELSKEEREERKKHRPRTRSGRVSKPPRHMVKDYKHIHPVDWDEEMDDSDGGYSDFKLSDEEGELEKTDARRPDSSYTPYTQLGTGKAKNWRCSSCEKAYIGRAGLARHYRLHPDHGHLDEYEDETIGVGADGLSQTADVLPQKNIVNGNKAPEQPRELKTYNPRIPTRLKHGYASESIVSKKRNRLKELVKQCDDEDLMEIVLPRLSKVVSCWEFLVMKTEKGRPPKPHISDILKEYESFYSQVKSLCDESLQPAQINGDLQTGQEILGHNQIQITDETLAKSLDLNTGIYDIKEQPAKEEPVFQYKLLTSDPSNLSSNPSQNAKKTVELVTRDQLVAESPIKKTKVLDIINNVTTAEISSKPSFLDVSQGEPIGASDSLSSVSHTALDFDKHGVHQSVAHSHVNMPEHIQVAENQVAISVSSKMESPALVSIPSAEATPNFSILPQPAVTPVSEHLEPTGPMVSILKSNFLANQSSVVKEDNVGTVQLQFADEGQEENVITTQQQMISNHIADGHQYQSHIIHNGQTQEQEIVNDETTQVLVQESEAFPHIGEEQDMMANVTSFQNPEGFILVKNPDGTLQIHGHTDQPIPLETVRALLAMDPTVHEVMDAE